MSVAVMAAMLVQGPAVADAPPGQRWRDGGQGYCRTPGPLPVLSAEDAPGQSRPRPTPRYAARARGGEADMVGAPPPPPPPAMTSAPEPGAAADYAPGAPSGEAKGEAGSEDRIASTMPPPGPYPRPYPRPQPRPQSGLLTAGEHDDLLNPELYAEYVRGSNLAQWVPELPQVDTGRVLTVAVRDSAGRPAPFVPVEISCSDGNRLTLTTMADGTVAFFPGLDRLSPQLRVRAGNAEWRAVSLSRGGGGQRIDFTTAQMVPRARKLDLMLAIDTTGSMGDEIRFLQAELGSIVDGLRARHRDLDIRVGFVFYRDLGDEYVTQTVPLSADINGAQAQLARQYASGGGDYPEAMDQAVIRAARQSWRPDAVKSLLLVADAPPHDDKVGRTWLAAENLRASRVHIVPVAASGVADKAEYVMRAMAAATQSRYTFLTDDSGIGNPHAPPAIDCYLVTRLDALLRRVIDSQISGRRIEPDRDEVIRSVGQQDGGRCVIPDGWRQ
jgi:hypothetical protein